MFLQNVCCAICAWLFGLSMCAWLFAFLYTCMWVCVLAGNTIYAVLCRGLKDTETYQGGISNSCPRQYWFPQPGPSRSLVPRVTPTLHYAQFHPLLTKPGHFVWLLVIISNNRNLIWQSLLPERYWSHPQWDALWNLVLFFICLYIICCPIRWHLHPVVWLIGWAPGCRLC